MLNPPSQHAVDTSPSEIFADPRIAAFKRRRLVALVDDSSEPSRATLVSPAQDISAELVNEILTLSGGITFVPMSGARARAFLLEPMSRSRTSPSPRGSSDGVGILAALESVEAREGVSTGISAADRAKTIAILGEPMPQPRKLVRPGHIFPIEVRPGGVIVKHALSEGAVDLVSMAGFTDAALSVDWLGSEGGLLSGTEAARIAAERDIPVFRLSELTRLRLEHESLVEKVAEAKLPTKIAGEMRCVMFRSTIDGSEHLVLVKGTIDPNVPVLARVQPEFAFEDVFGGGHPSTRGQIDGALAAIAARGSGILVYLRRPFAGQLGEQLLRPDVNFHERPVWMMREYGLGAQILRALGVKKVDILTGSKRNLVGLKSFGIEIVSQLPIPEHRPA